MIARHLFAVAALACMAAAAAAAQPAQDGAAAASEAAKLDQVYGAFARACIAPARARRGFAEAIGAIPGWHRIRAPSSLPNSAGDPGMPTWHVPAEGVDIYVHLDAAAAGDCAVSAWRIDGMGARRAFYARLPAERLRLLDAQEILPGVEVRGYDGEGWDVVGSIITNANPNPERPVLFIGIQPVRE
jgi:hypothetical protein